MRRMSNFYRVIAAAGLILLVALAALPFFSDINTFKPRVETAISEAVGMAVTVEGKLGIKFRPGLHLTLSDVHVRNRGSEFAFVEHADLAIELLPLIQQQIRYGFIATQGVHINILRGRDGKYNYERAEASRQTFHSLALPKIAFSNLLVSYADLQSGSGFEFKRCEGELTDMRHPGDAPLLKRLTLAGQFACAEVGGKSPVATDLNFQIVATDGVFDFKSVTMQAFGGQGTGTMRVDRSAEIPNYQINYTLSKFHIEQFFRTQSKRKSVSGLMNFSAKLSMQGRTRLAMRQSAKGDASLSGTNLTLNGVDLDQQLLKFESSQNLNLIDMSALLLAGPLGLAATKSYELLSPGEKSAGQMFTPIRMIVSQWKVENGIAHAQDVALATNKSRLALHGGLNFVSDEYQNVVVALLDANGCAKASQTINGLFSKPRTDKSIILVPVGVLANGFFSLVDKAKKLVSGASKSSNTCEVFYSGAVKPPA